MVHLLWAALAAPVVFLAAVFVTACVRRYLLPRHPDMTLGYLFAQCLGRVLVLFLFRVRRSGLEHIPKTGGALIIANHVSFADVLLLGLYLERPIRFLSWEGFEHNPFTRVIMRTFNSIPVSKTKAKDAIRKAVESIKAGDIVAIFPEGQITRSGALNAFRPGYELIARMAGAPVIPSYTDGLWGSVFSYHGGPPLRKLPTSWPRPITLTYGPPLANNSVECARQALLDLGAEAYARRPELNRNLAAAVVRSVCAHPGVVSVIDRAAGRTAMTSARLLAVARAYSLRLREIAPERRVGIILPPGIPCTVANLACVLAGKTPVNLNFTLGRAALEQCFAKAGIRTVLTVAAFREKVSEKLDVPWPENTVDMLPGLRSLSKPRVLASELAVRALPGSVVCALWRVPGAHGDDEASILFTSGSSGAPKGVVLSHRNILANAEQVSESGIVPECGRLLANLPIFHSFGHTVTLWFALTRGVTCVCLPTPLDVKKNAEVIREEGVTCLIGTPTFYRGYFKRAEPSALASVQRVIAGAEKTPAGFAKEWVDTFGGAYFEGYGATETTPVVAINVPDYADPEFEGGIRQGSKPGSVGRLVVGMSARVTDPETGAPQSFGGVGLLALRGANVFGGYLDDPARTAEALRDGWYATGDLVRIDAEGFIFIEGRLSRFSKIGGEMVPHGAVEEAVVAALGLPTEGEYAVAVSARADAQKGESLVLLTTIDIDVEALRKALAEAGLSNLWIPKIVVRVPRIPVLATGKLDLRGIKLAAEAPAAG